MVEDKEGQVYPDDAFESWQDRMKKKGELNPFATLFVVAASIYLMYISAIPIVDYFTNGIDQWGLIFNLILFIIGLGAMLGGLAMARHTIIYGRLLDATFEKEIYSRLEPAFEEVAKLRAEYDAVYGKVDRMNLHLTKIERGLVNGNGNGNGRVYRNGNGQRYTFLMILTMGILFFLMQFPLGYVPYALTALFLVWWMGITSEFNLWSLDLAWIWAIFPIFVVPVISLLVHVSYGIGITIGVLSLVLVLYAISFHTWARYYLEGVTPFTSLSQRNKPSGGGEE